jgi:hypothetical protein
MSKTKLNDLDYLELTDITTEELRKYSKDELISNLKHRCTELLEAEKEIADLQYSYNPQTITKQEELNRLITAKLFIIDKLNKSDERKKAIRYQAIRYQAIRYLNELAGIKQVLGLFGVGLQVDLNPEKSTYELTIL